MRSRKTSWLFLSRIHSGGSAFSIVAAAVECRANFPGTFYRLLLSVELSSASFTRMKWTLLFHLQCVFKIAFSYLIYLKIDFVTRKHTWRCPFCYLTIYTITRGLWTAMLALALIKVEERAQNCKTFLRAKNIQNCISIQV